MPHFEFMEEQRSKPRLQLTRRELKTLLDKIQNDVTLGHYKVVEVIRPIRFFSDGVIFEAGQEKEKVRVYVTDWFIHVIKDEQGFEWRSDMPAFLSPVK